MPSSHILWNDPLYDRKMSFYRLDGSGPVWRDLLAIAVAFGSSGLYSLGASFQATEAARVGRELSLLPSLLGRLARRRRWLVDATISLAGWPLRPSRCCLHR